MSCATAANPAVNAADATPNPASAIPARQAIFLDTPGIITDKRNKLEEKMMAAVQQVGATMCRHHANQGRCVEAPKTLQQQLAWLPSVPRLKPAHRRLSARAGCTDPDMPCQDKLACASPPHLAPGCERLRLPAGHCGRFAQAGGGPGHDPARGRLEWAAHGSGEGRPPELRLPQDEE